MKQIISASRRTDIPAFYYEWLQNCLKNKSVINWEKTDKELVTALIELKVTPQRGEGFDKIAERIYKFPEVKSVYLMAGAYDLTVIIEGKTIKDVALFVSNRLATMERVLSTGTHFVLKKYKDEGIIFDENEKDSRQVITLWVILILTVL